MSLIFLNKNNCKMVKLGLCVWFKNPEKLNLKCTFKSVYNFLLLVLNVSAQQQLYFNSDI